MYKINFTFALLLIAGLLTLIACNKDDESNLSSNPPEVIIDWDGVSLDPNCIVTFESYGKFRNIYEQVLLNEDGEDQFSQQFPCHHSSTEVLSDIERFLELETTTELQVEAKILENNRAVFVEEDSTINTISEDHTLSLFINQNGVFKIADSTYYFSNDYLRSFVFNGDNLDEKLKEIERVEESTSDVTVYEIQRDYSRSEKTCHKYSGSKRRLKGNIWRVNLFVFKGLGAVSKSQKKRWRWWFGSKADKLDLSLSYLNYTRNKSKRNKKSVRMRIHFESLFFSTDGVTEIGEVLDVNTPIDAYHCRNNNCCSTERN